MALQDYVNKKPTIRTERLTMRPLCAADVSALKEWMPDKSIYAYWGKGPGRTDKQPELLFEKAGKAVQELPSRRRAKRNVQSHRRAVGVSH